MSYTKGKWTKFNDRIEVQGQFHDTVICRLERIKEKDANQSLISASPDLLEALKVCYKSLCTYGSHPIIEKQVENAIRKAEGRTA